MNLVEKIVAIYPLLSDKDFLPNGTIQIQNDGEGQYIKLWVNENPQPTEKQLQEIR
jgi:hypothetical protein